MSDSTRDIAVRTEQKVEAIEKRLASLELTVQSQTLAIAERRGMERLAQWIIGVVGGGAGASILALIMKFAGLFSSASPFNKIN